MTETVAFLRDIPQITQDTMITGDQNISIYDYRCDMETAIPKNIQVFRGESVKIVASLYDNNQKQIPSGTASFYWQKKEMEGQNQWWIKSATISEGGDLEVVFDSRTQDDGSDSYTWFFGINTEDGINERAHGTIFMRHGIGTPNELPLPTPRIDFDTVEVVNPPWVPLITAEAEARTSADGALNTRINGAVSAIETHTQNSTIHVTATDKSNWNNKVPRNGDTGLTGNYRTTGNVKSVGISLPGHIQPESVSLQGGYGDITIVGLAEDPTQSLLPQNRKLWMANIYADRIVRFDGDTGQGTVTHRFPSADGTLALVSQIPSVSGKADKVANATSGNFAGLDSNGNLIDSGKKASDFATPSDLPGSETWTFEIDDGQGGTTTVTKRVAVYPAQQGA